MHTLVCWLGAWPDASSFFQVAHAVRASERRMVPVWLRSTCDATVRGRYTARRRLVRVHWWCVGPRGQAALSLFATYSTQEAGVRSPYREVRVSTAVDHFKHVGLVCFGHLDVGRESPG